MIDILVELDKLHNQDLQLQSNEKFLLANSQSLSGHSHTLTMGEVKSYLVE